MSRNSARLGELFDTADALFNGHETSVSTNVKADFKEGSFEVFFHIHQALSDPNAVLIPGVFVLGASPLINQVMGKLIDKAQDKMTGVVVEGLFKLLETLSGKTPERIERDDHRNVSIFVVGDGNIVTVNQETTKLYQNPRVRELASRVGSPLKKVGYSKLRIKRDADEIIKLENRDFPEVEDTPALAASVADAEAPQQLIVQFLKPTFIEGKWSVSDGTKNFQVAMEDQTFKGRVHARDVGFYDGDLYRVEMVTTQRVKNGKLSTERRITRVISPVEMAVQESLELPTPRVKSGGRKFKS